MAFPANPPVAAELPDDPDVVEPEPPAPPMSAAPGPPPPAVKAGEVTVVLLPDWPARNVFVPLPPAPTEPLMTVPAVTAMSVAEYPPPPPPPP